MGYPIPLWHQEHRSRAMLITIQALLLAGNLDWIYYGHWCQSLNQMSSFPTHTLEYSSYLRPACLVRTLAIWKGGAISYVFVYICRISVCVKWVDGGMRIYFENNTKYSFKSQQIHNYKQTGQFFVRTADSGDSELQRLHQLLPVLVPVFIAVSYTHLTLPTIYSV